MTFSYWIQKHDYTADETDNITLAEALSAFEDFDWSSELNALDEDEERRDCPPGIGIHNGFNYDEGEGMLLHICPVDAAMAFFSFHRRTRRRFLGLWPTSYNVEFHNAENVALSEIPALIEQFFAGNVEAIIRRCG